MAEPEDNRLSRIKRIKERLEDMLTRIKVKTPLESTETLQGKFYSIFENLGIERVDSRPYSSGDDLNEIDIRFTLKRAILKDKSSEKTVDWKNSLAARRVFIKQSKEDHHHVLYSVLDIGDEMFFGFERDYEKKDIIFRNKLFYLLKIFYFTGYNAIHNQINFGYKMVFDSPYIDIQGPSSRDISNIEIGWNNIQRYILNQPTVRKRNKFRLKNALEFVNGLLNKRAVLLIVSDFNYPREEFNVILNLLNLLNEKHLVMPFWLFDPHELPEAFVDKSKIKRIFSFRNVLFIDDSKNECKDQLNKIQQGYRAMMTANKISPLEFNVWTDEEGSFSKKLEDYFSDITMSKKTGGSK